MNTCVNEENKLSLSLHSINGKIYVGASYGCYIWHGVFLSMLKVLSIYKFINKWRKEGGASYGCYIWHGVPPLQLVQTFSHSISPTTQELFWKKNSKTPRMRYSCSSTPPPSPNFFFSNFVSSFSWNGPIQRPREKIYKNILCRNFVDPTRIRATCTKVRRTRLTQ